MIQCNRCGLPKPPESFAKLKSGARRKMCARCRKGKPPRLAKETSPTLKFTRPLDSRRYIVTAAQNATQVDQNFFKVLAVAAKAMNAELVVIPLRYKNPTSLWTQQQDSDEWWAPEVIPFLYNDRGEICENLVIAGDVKTQPTASSPLSGFESLTGAESCILGHPKMQYRSVPVPIGRYPKILTTTGVCTVSNYTDTKAGKLGDFHHFLGGLVVEIQGGTFHLRQINADRKDGSFIDLDKLYTTRGVRRAPPALALALGDTHVRVADPEVDRATFGLEGIVETLNPDTLIWHDVFDGETCNPHETGNPFIAEAKRRAYRQDVRSELEDTINFIKERTGKRQSVLVDSNHHDFLARWVIRTDWKQDLKNAAFYLETAQAMLASARMTSGGAEYDDPFRYWVRKLAPDSRFRCLKTNESFKIAGIECGLHGNNGPNGARGSLKNLSRLGAKVISGHTHSPGIEEGHYQTGTSSMRRLSYMKGPGSHLNTHVVIYASGKRSLITVIDGSWRLI